MAVRIKGSVTLFLFARKLTDIEEDDSESDYSHENAAWNLIHKEGGKAIPIPTPNCKNNCYNK